MWIFTEIGFYSVVTDRDDADFVWVRGRDREDLERAIEFTKKAWLLGFPESDPDDLLELGGHLEIIELTDSDYRYRFKVVRTLWAVALSSLAGDARYDNFKNAVAKRDRDRAQLYFHVWGLLRRIQDAAEKDDSPLEESGVWPEVPEGWPWGETGAPF